MNEKLKDLLQRKQKLAEEINKLACEQRDLTMAIRELERIEKKEDMLNGRSSAIWPGRTMQSKLR